MSALKDDASPKAPVEPNLLPVAASGEEPQISVVSLIAEPPFKSIEHADCASLRDDRIPNLPTTM